MNHPTIEICEDDRPEGTFFQGRVGGVSFNIRDSMAVGRFHKINDVDVHEEENSHLEDLMIPHGIVRLDEVNGGKIIPPAVENPNADAIQDQPKRQVRFGSIVIRDYDMILGDNPSCVSGIPLAISWNYTEYQPLDVDEYELHRSPRRSMENMQLNISQRMRLLSEAGFTKVDIHHTLKQINRTKRNRRLTAFLAETYPLMEDVEAAVESARRKFKRLIKKGNDRAGKIAPHSQVG
ncbi:hypothetical protein ACHAXA_004226 [Cyclostephanos tholiformis]|uniref:Uncharacterized protein n=1 Tax=Cyclostephanos tholiformis TaxID=382380 RepID=A0ABD3R439_9STRA